jgi:basic amino acid/polyamine antiporter, APA family
LEKIALNLSVVNSKKISFLSAVLVNINIVIGSAFFLGVGDISAKAGFIAPITWVLCAVLLMPLVFIFSKFAHKYPAAGGIYVYSQNELGRFWGYLAAWLYFVGTTAGNAMVLRCFSKYLYELAWVGKLLKSFSFSLLHLEIAVALVFLFLSLSNIRIFERAQMLFSGLKMLPFLVLIVGMIALFAPSNLASATAFTSLSVYSAVPTVLFAYIGIEACSAIIDKVENSQNQGFKVILTSFALIASVYTVGQLLVVGMFGQSGDSPFLNVLPRILENQALIGFGNQFIYTAILFSFLGGFYGLFYVNSWNLYAMAEERSIAGHIWWKKLNAQQAPWASIMLQSGLLISMLVIAEKGDLLIAMSDLGVLVAYFLTAIAYLRASPGFLGFLGAGAIIALASFLFQEVHSIGWITTLPFWIMFLIGFILYRRPAAQQI